jgi:hypothetical protein
MDCSFVSAIVHFHICQTRVRRLQVRIGYRFFQIPSGEQFRQVRKALTKGLLALAAEVFARNYIQEH